MDNESTCVVQLTTGSDEYEYEQMESLLVPKIVIMSVLGAFTAAANGVLLWTILSQRFLRKRSYFFVVALAFADFCMGFISIPLHVMAEAGVLAG